LTRAALELGGFSAFLTGQSVWLSVL
jgi:hypothetical protein